MRTAQPIRDCRTGPRGRAASDARPAQRPAPALHHRAAATERGSAIVAILLIAAVAAVVASYLLSSAINEQKLATRSYYQSAAANLAEAGIEEAMWAANNSYFDTTHGWSDASDGTGAKTHTVLTGLALAQGSGEIYTRVDSASTSNPIIYALGVVRLPGQPVVFKQLRVKLDRRSIYANAVVAKGTIVFNGNTVSIDAYDSSHGNWNSSTNRLDKATVSTNATSNADLSVNNADIYGSVATGGGEPVVGPNGSILGATSPSGLPNNIDPANVRRDFSYNIPDITAPTATVSLGAVSDNLSLPRSGDTPDASGRYTYSATSLSLNNKTLTVTDKVSLVVSGDVSIGGGSGSIVVTNATNSTLSLYAASDVSISGNGAINETSSPPKMTLYGTRSQTDAATLGKQEFDLRGNASYYGLVYAPNADVTLRGGGSTGTFNGAIIGSTVTFNGNYNFHYDIQLGSLQSDRYFRPVTWIELTAPAGSGAALARDNRSPFNAVL